MEIGEGSCLCSRRPHLRLWGPRVVFLHVSQVQGSVCLEGAATCWGLFRTLQSWSRFRGCFFPHIPTFSLFSLNRMPYA